MSKTIKKFRYDDDGQEEGSRIERYRYRRSLKKLKYATTIGSLDKTTDENDDPKIYEIVK